jgi:hypothetical protein
LKPTLLLPMFGVLIACLAANAQTVPSASDQLRPFSEVALGGGISTLGINMQLAVNANRYMNIRATGNYFKYTLTNLNTNGFNVSGNLNLATAGASLDFYPFPRHGFRVSPGILFVNDNAASGTMAASAGTSFTLNNVTYYSSPTDPVSGTASLGLNTTKPAATMTVGWGNMIPRYRGGHWSFPVEVGVAFIGQPAVNLALTSGQVCANAQGTEGCQNVAGDPTLASNVQAQIAKYQNDLEPFKYYPILSFGVGYNFHIRH